ncbi:MAG: holo-ACP synthase [Actinomycetota bacterium]
MQGTGPAGSIRIGIDLVAIDRIATLLKQWPNLEKRLFTPGELAYASSSSRPAQHLAARFAAKEATFKALGKGWPSLSWHDVEVVSEGGPPILRLTGRAGAEAAGATALVSLSHDAGIAIAQVVLVGR